MADWLANAAATFPVGVYVIEEPPAGFVNCLRRDGDAALEYPGWGSFGL